jgi:hypothetical protein
MTNLSKWNVSVEYGPVAADVHHIVVEASSIEGARKKAAQWAKDNNIRSPMISEPYEDTHEESYDEILDWTSDEEEAFMHIVDVDGNTDER